MTIVRVLNWNLDAYNFTPNRRDDLYKEIHLQLPSPDDSIASVVILTEVPKLLLSEDADSLQHEFKRYGFNIYAHRPMDTSRRHGALIALSHQFSDTHVVNVDSNVSALIDNLVLKTKLAGVGMGVIFALRPLVRNGNAEDYRKRADGLFELLNNVTTVAQNISTTVNAAFILGGGDFNHAKVYGVGDESWDSPAVRKLYLRKHQEPIAYQRIKTVLHHQGLSLVTPKDKNGVNLDTSIGQFSLDHTITPMHWELLSTRYVQRPNAQDGEHKLQVSDFSATSDSSTTQRSEGTLNH